MRSEGTIVGLSVCLTGLYLAGRAFIHSTNDATYLAGNEVEKNCAILSETSPLQSLSPTGIVQLTSAAAIFPRLGTRLRTIFFEHVCAAAIFLWQRRRAGTCELLFSLPIMPPSKVCPKCQAVVPIRLKVCKFQATNPPFYRPNFFARAFIFSQRAYHGELM